MAKPLSEDLRIRTVRAVEGGMSRRAAAERSASRLRARCALSGNGARAGRRRPSGKVATSARSASKSTMMRSWWQSRPSRI